MTYRCKTLAAVFSTFLGKKLRFRCLVRTVDQDPKSYKQNTTNESNFFGLHVHLIDRYDHAFCRIQFLLQIERHELLIPWK